MTYRHYETSHSVCQLFLSNGTCTFVDTGVPTFSFVDTRDRFFRLPGRALSHWQKASDYLLKYKKNYISKTCLCFSLQVALKVWLLERL